MGWEVVVAMVVLTPQPRSVVEKPDSGSSVSKPDPAKRLPAYCVK